MTADDWLTCTDPQRMLYFLQGNATQRKLRLFACACCRRAPARHQDVKFRAALDLAEQCAAGRVPSRELERAERPDPWNWSGPLPNPLAAAVTHSDAFEAALACARESAGLVNLEMYHPDHPEKTLAARDAERAAQVNLLHDLFGHLFPPTRLDPRWRAANDWAAVRLAQAIYEKRTFDHLPILGDALEDAGCAQPALLEHCRQGGEHARGCWVVDLVLGQA